MGTVVAEALRRCQIAVLGIDLAIPGRIRVRIQCKLPAEEAVRSMTREVWYMRCDLASLRPPVGMFDSRQHLPAARSTIEEGAYGIDVSPLA